MLPRGVRNVLVLLVAFCLDAECGGGIHTPLILKLINSDLASKTGSPNAEHTVTITSIVFLGCSSDCPCSPALLLLRPLFLPRVRQGLYDVFDCLETCEGHVYYRREVMLNTKGASTHIWGTSYSTESQVENSPSRHTHARISSRKLGPPRRPCLFFGRDTFRPRNKITQQLCFLPWFFFDS